MFGTNVYLQYMYIIVCGVCLRRVCDNVCVFFFFVFTDMRS